MGVCSFHYLYVFGVNRGGVLLKSTTEREWLGLVPDYLYSFIMYCNNVLLRSRRLRCGLFFTICTGTGTGAGGVLLRIIGV